VSAYIITWRLQETVTKKGGVGNEVKYKKKTAHEVA